METKDIRPEDLEKEQLRLLREDAEKMLERESEFINVVCPACESFDKYQHAFVKDGFRFVRCEKCDTIFVNPRPTFDMLEEYYTSTSKNMNFWNDEFFPVTEKYRREKIAKPSVERVLEFCNTFGVVPNTMLELGAGFGIFAEEMLIGALSMGIDPFNLTVVEASEKFADTCRSKGIYVVNTLIEKFISDRSYDVVLALEVISHLFCPKKMIEVTYRSLREGGLFILATPNSHGFDLLMLEQYSDNVGSPNHLNYFNNESISILLQDGGFDILEVITPGELDAELVRKKVIDREIELEDPFLIHILIDKWKEHGEAFQNYLVSNKLSSHMWVVARKK